MDQEEQFDLISTSIYIYKKRHQETYTVIIFVLHVFGQSTRLSQIEKDSVLICTDYGYTPGEVHAEVEEYCRVCVLGEHDVKINQSKSMEIKPQSAQGNVLVTT